MRFVNPPNFDILPTGSLLPPGGNINQWVPSEKVRFAERVCVRKDNEVTVTPPVVWLNVDVVSLSFKRELIAVFRQRSV